MERAAGIVNQDWEEIPDEAKARIVENERLSESFNELALFYDTLKRDVEALAGQTGNGEQGDQPWRRAMFRLVFAWIEGVVHLLKQVACRTQGGFLNAQFSAAELAALRGESYLLEEDGKAAAQPSVYPGLARNLRLSYAAVAKGFGVNGRVAIRPSEGWRSFMESIAVRNRITRPASIDALSISDDEMDALTGTITWFNEQIPSLFIKVEETLGPISARIRAEGKVAQRRILDNALAALQRASDVDSIIKVVDKLLDSEECLDQAMENELSQARVKLKELKGYFLDSWET